MLLPSLLAALLVGALAGLLAGMLGIGGGLVIVPALVWLYAGLDFPATSLMQCALATSLASILFTGTGSVIAHHRRAAVRWDLVRHLAPALMLGAFLGSHIADLIGSEWLMRLFGIFAGVVGLRMLVAGSTRPVPGQPERPVSALFHGLVGSLIGVASAFFGIGGGSLTVPYLNSLHVRMTEAVATSSACGMPIALAGAAGFILSGLGQTDLPEGALGYVHLPTLAALAIGSVPMTAAGVRLAHHLPAGRLKQLFALVLLLVATDFLFVQSGAHG